ncbi:MAG: glycosyltransferase, partial [Gemmatimonadales bacterium]
MRILHIATAFPRFPGDLVSHWLVELLQQQRRAGHAVEVLCPAYRGGGAQEYDGIPVHRFRYFPAPWEDLTHDEATPDRVRRAWRYKLIAACYIVCGILASWRLGRRERYDVIHVHWPMPHALFGAAVRAAGEGGAPLVTLWYGVELHWVEGSLRWLRWLVRWALRTSDQVVAISSYTAGAIRRLADVPVCVIPYTVSLAKDGSAIAPGARTGQRGAGPRILFV